MTKGLRPTQFLFLFLCLLAILIAAGFYGLQRAVLGNEDLPEFENLSFISAAAYLFLLTGIGGLRIASSQRSKQPARAFPWVVILVLAYAIPLVISWLPALVTINPAGIARQLPHLDVFMTWQPWLPALQAFALVILLLAGGEIRVPKQVPDVTTSNLVTAAVWGLGFWLVMVFTFRLTALLAPARTGVILPGTTLLSWPVTLAGLTLLPIGGEILFRGRLLDQWQSRHGLITGSLLSAAVFALACMRPLLWLPAFFVGIGLNWLVRRNPGLQITILAHAVLNLLILIFIPSILV